MRLSHLVSAPWFLVFGPLLCACGTTTSILSYPDGSRAFQIDCSMAAANACATEAKRRCPEGYRALATEAKSVTVRCLSDEQPTPTSANADAPTATSAPAQASVPAPPVDAETAPSSPDADTRSRVARIFPRLSLTAFGGVMVEPTFPAAVWVPVQTQLGPGSGPKSVLISSSDTVFAWGFRTGVFILRSVHGAIGVSAAYQQSRLKTMSAAGTEFIDPTYHRFVIQLVDGHYLLHPLSGTSAYGHLDLGGAWANYGRTDGTRGSGAGTSLGFGIGFRTAPFGPVSAFIEYGFLSVLSSVNNSGSMSCAGPPECTKNDIERVDDWASSSLVLLGLSVGWL
jgi:hypothetical protein